MKTRKFYIFFCLLILSVFFGKAQLVLNEVSQGASGSKEYAEFVVVGSTPTCTTVQCVDLRGYYLDDNNGTFATGGGVGIQMGCIRLTNSVFWSCIPVGTIIVVYDEGDRNSNIPPDDLSMSDGNCRLIIPGNNATILERNTSAPASGAPTYLTTGFGTGGTWANTVGMLNTSDSFQSRDASGNLLSAVSWGNDNMSTIIYFAGSQSGKVINNLNSVDTNPLNQANWATATVAGNETPGTANNAANLAWINSMNFSCGTLIPTALTTTLISTNTGCTCTGSATVAASGATSPYTYSWSPSANSTTNISNLCAGNYSVTVSSANGCVQTNTVNIASINPLTATVTSTDVSCHGLSDGSATVAVSNGANPITYTWSPNGGNNANATNLSVGNYSVSVTDANSCTLTTTAVINQPAAITATISSTNVSCNGGSNGAATITPTGGTTPYTYTWSPSGGNNSTATNLSFGTYSVHILDAHLCVKDTTLTITQPTPLTLSLTSTAETCEQHNGTATAMASGGSGTLTYTWSPTGGNTSIASNLSAGIYTATVTDSLLCSLSNTITVQGFLSPVLSVSSASVLCNGGNSGTATSTITSGGTPAYTYTWFPVGGNNSSASNLSVGNYTLIVTDSKNCSDTAYANIIEPTSITATLTSTPATCGNNNGTTTGLVTGGISPYSYTWSPSGGNNFNANNLAPGDYTLNVSDANLCTYSASINVSNKPSPILSISSNSVTCFGASTGSASVSINTGTGTAPFTYTWSPSGGNNATATNLSAGNYTITVSDSANCVATATVDIIQPTQLTATITNTQASCNQTNGTATVTASGGTVNYTYTWSPSGGNNATATNLSAGNYTVAITDANTCTFSAQTTITQNPVINLTVTTTPATCGNNNGTATAIATGGIPTQSGLTYTWSTSPVQTTTTAINLPGNNTYVLVVSDSVGCVATQSVTIGNKPSPVLSVSSTSVLCNNTNTGSANVSINANTGTAPFSYTWSPSGGNNANATNLAAGNYTIAVTDSANCMATSTIAITQPPALTVTATSTLATCGNANGVATCTVMGGVSNYTYTWSPSGGNNTTANNLAGNNTYTIHIRDANNCKDSASIFVNQTPALTLSVTTTHSVTCNSGSDGSITTTSSGSGTTTYNWFPNGGTNLTANNLSGTVSGTTYTLVGNDGGCKDSVTATIVEAPPLTLTVNNPTICVGQTATLTANGASTYTWSTTETTSSIQVNPATNTTYTVVGQNASGCISTPQTASVSVYPALSISVTPSSTAICSGGSALLSATASGGNGTNSFTWNTGSTNSNINVNPSNTTVYTVSVHNATCASTASTTAEVQVYATPTITINTTPSSGCENVCVSFTANATNTSGNNITSYNWNFGDGNSYASSTLSAGHCYSYPNSYNVTLTALTQNNCSVTVTQANAVQVYQNPTALFTASPSFTVTSDESLIQFFDHSQTNITQWNWQIDTTSFTTQNTAYNFTHEGTYSVTLFVTDANGCSDSTTNTVVVEPTYAFYAPNAFTPNGDEKNPLFLPLGTGWDTTSYNLHIYDRWGNSILHTTNPNQGWDGTKGGKPVQEDTYVWMVDLYDLFGNPHQYKGQVTLIK